MERKNVDNTVSTAVDMTVDVFKRITLTIEKACGENSAPVKSLVAFAFITVAVRVLKNENQESLDGVLTHVKQSWEVMDGP